MEFAELVMHVKMCDTSKQLYQTVLK